MASKDQESTVTVPAELVRECSGFSFDMGGSVIKIVYRTKEDYEEAVANQGKGATGTVRLVSFPRKDLDEAIEFIKKNVYITPGDDTTVYITGLGGSQYKTRVESALNVKIVLLPEEDCFTQGFQYLLRRMPRQELIHPYAEAAANIALKENKAWVEPFVENVKAGKSNMNVPGVAIEDLTAEVLMGNLERGMNRPSDPAKTMVEGFDDVFPAALGMFGSAFAFFKVEENTDCSNMDMSMIGGRTCLAMATMFLGCKSFSEFLELARKGNSDNVDYCMKNMMQEVAGNSGGSGEEDYYQSFTNALDEEDNNLIFCLGQGAGKSLDEFKREDVAAALMRLHCYSLAMFLDANLRDAKFQDIKHVFMAGGFPGNHLARFMITKEVVTRLITQRFAGETRDPFQVHFLKQGQHLGCLGGLINSVEKFIKTADNQ